MPSSNEDVNLVIDRRNESQRWFKANYYDELVEVFRSIKCKTKPIMKRDQAGKETNKEDHSRTNVAMPEISLVFRRNTARMTANPYELRYTGANDPMVNEMLSALAAQQYDRSDEWFHDRRLVMMGEAFGFGYTKLFWDTLTRTMQFRKNILNGDQVVFRDRAAIMRAIGAPEDEIQGAVGQLGDQVSDDEATQFAARTGNEIVVPTQVSKYEGPCVKSVWIGDLFLEPNVLTLNDSNFVVEQYQETKLWLAKMSKLEYRDPDSGDMKPVFDKEMCQKLIDADPEPDQREDDLKQFMRESIGKSGENDDPLPKRLRGQKKYDIIEQHLLDDDGRIWITYVAEKMREGVLGKMPCPVDCYGKYLYTEYVPLPDMVDSHGDSTPRLMRHLHAMHNMTVAQNFDMVTDILRPIILEKTGAQIETEMVDRGRFRVIRCTDPNGYVPFPDRPIPPAAFERESQVLRMEAMLEPSLNTVDTGTASNPMAGKLATTAMLNAKAADSLTQFKIDGRNLYLRELAYKKLWMNQQLSSEPWRIESDFHTDELKQQVKALPPASEKQQLPEWAYSDRNGKTVAIRLDPMEIQEDIHVEPVSGSYLSVADELNKQTAMDLQQVATANPGLLDQRKIALVQLKTIPNLDGQPQDFLLPQQPPDPMAAAKLSASLSIKFETLQPDAQAFFLGQLGYQENPADTAAKQQIHGLAQMSQAADHATNLLSPAEQQPNESEVSVSPRAAAATAG